MDQIPEEDKFYANYLYYENEEEKKIIHDFLYLWRKYLLNLLPSNYEYNDESLIDRPPIEDAPGTLALKIKVTAKKEPTLSEKI